MTDQADAAATYRVGAATLGPPLLSLDYRQTGPPTVDRRMADRAAALELHQRLARVEELSHAIYAHLTRPPWWRRWAQALYSRWRTP